jgi:uncharacterized protein (DUF2235 family)
MKRLAFCFDGTWNKIDGQHPTNVARVAQSVSRFDRDQNPQLIYYDEGVGTSATDRLTGGMFGHGLIDKVTRAYHFLVLNYEPGDQISVFGFSRGAFSARSFVGLIRNCGIMSRRSLGHIRAAIDLYLSRTKGSSPGSEKARQFRMRHCPKLCLPGDLEWRRAARPDLPHDDLTELRVEYLGIWDTVGALGVPAHLRALAWINRKYGFHDTELSSFVRRARHAVAADEMRRTFEPGMWSNLDDLNARSDGDERRYEQLIFPGTHSAVGGGGPIRGLSDAALDWIVDGARRGGLEFDQDDQSPVFQLLPDHRAQLFNQTGKSKWSLKDWLMGFGIATRKFPDMDRSALHDMVVRRFAASPSDLPERKAYRPKSLEALWPTLEAMAALQATQGRERLESLSSTDPRALRAPDRVRKYVIKAGDTLTDIAERQMGGKSNWKLLAQHNRNLGYLFEDDEIYAGSILEIPEYDAPSAPTPEAASPAGDGN